MRTLVSANAAAGGLSVAVIPERLPGRGPRVHLVGGAGSAVNLTRELLRLGCEVTGGIAHEHDSDEKLWKSLGVEHLAVGAFSRIGDEDIERAADLVAAADLTVLCAFPVGTGNLGNLRLAARARRLVVMEPGPGDTPRSFFAEEGRGLFAEVTAKADVLTYEQLLARVKKDGSAPARAAAAVRATPPATDQGAGRRAAGGPRRRKR